MKEQENENFNKTAKGRRAGFNLLPNLDRKISLENVTADSYVGNSNPYLMDEAGQFPVSHTTNREITNEQFKAEVEKTSKYWDSDIYNPCLTCCKITKNTYCDECLQQSVNDGEL